MKCILELPFVWELTNSTSGRKDDESNINITEDRKLMSFLDKSPSSLWESDLPACYILNLLDLSLHSPHISNLYSLFSREIFYIYLFILFYFKDCTHQKRERQIWAREVRHGDQEDETVTFCFYLLL